ncbi:hypothetical protein [Brucella anthropi]|uniref:hypothetical protein n=1 Tax=Brucella anthropi TaxID=529 RepID=UPI003985CD48
MRQDFSTRAHLPVAHLRQISPDMVNPSVWKLVLKNKFRMPGRKYGSARIGILEDMPMMLKDIQALEHAARTAMAGNDDPLPVQQRSLKPTHVGLAFVMLAGAAYLLLA